MGLPLSREAFISEARDSTALLSEVEKRLGEKGAKKINGQIYQSNTKSLKFFKARGYETHLDLVMVGKHLKN